MRSEQDMLDLIIRTAAQDDRIRAVIMNGSRVNPTVPRDFFQDFDIVYFVTDVATFRDDPTWINRFGELMILQLPEAMQDPPPHGGNIAVYLMQFTDGNRIDLGLFPLDRLPELCQDSLSRALLDKDGLLPLFDPPSDRNYLPRPPSAKAFADCCNEFWWIGPYVAKGLWREEILYAKYMLDRHARDELMKMLTWYVGMKTGFSCSPGKLAKYLKRYLEPELWLLLEKTFADAGYDHTWDALGIMGELFRITAQGVAQRFGFDYPQGDDERVSAHLCHVRHLPRDAAEMY